MRRGVVFVALMCALATGACSKGSQTTAKKPMTTAERDSAIGESKLPGAGVVKKSLAVSDSANARAERENEAAQH
ncbi:MAG TPA: hypothetical protein VF247_04145 [Candidatus Krumholzibacteria bacterium]